MALYFSKDVLDPTNWSDVVITADGYEVFSETRRVFLEGDATASYALKTFEARSGVPFEILRI